MPLVSVVMPAYNAENYIEEAVNSILGQTHNDFELIIVDDCSTDNTANILDGYSDKRVFVTHNEVNCGISYSTNKAISLSTGKYIAIMDDDDIAMSKRLEIQVDYLENNETIDIVGGNTEMIDQFGKHLSYCIPPRNNPLYFRAMLLFEGPDFANGTAMIRKDFISNNNLRYRDNYLGMQDYQFYIESSKIGFISSVDDVLLKYRIHTDNETSRQYNNNGSERAKLYSKMRHESLEKSGFDLSENDYRIIDRIMIEIKPRFTTKEDIMSLYILFKKVLRQSYEMNVEYKKELSFYLRKKFSEIINRTDIFEETFYPNI